MHRETTISREIKLLKNKFELLEKNRQFRSILQKSSNHTLVSTSDNANNNDDLNCGIDPNDFQRGQRVSEQTGDAESSMASDRRRGSLSDRHDQLKRGSKSVRIKLSKLHSFGQYLAPLFKIKRRPKVRLKSNKVSSFSGPSISGSLELDDSHQTNGSTTVDVLTGELVSVMQPLEQKKSVTSNQIALESSSKRASKGSTLFGRLFK